jgi:Histidine phosphatase superfamily (branch 2)
LYSPDELLKDTLDDKMCPGAGDSDAQTEAWRDTFAPAIAQRLNAAAPGATLDNADIPSLISLCAFDTLAKETPSPWCGVFSQREFDGFEYYGDLDKYYNTG